MASSLTSRATASVSALMFHQTLTAIGSKRSLMQPTLSSFPCQRFAVPRLNVSVSQPRSRVRKWKVFLCIFFFGGRKKRDASGSGYRPSLLAAFAALTGRGHGRHHPPPMQSHHANKVTKKTGRERKERRRTVSTWEQPTRDRNRQCLSRCHSALANPTYELRLKAARCAASGLFATS